MRASYGAGRGLRRLRHRPSRVGRHARLRNLPGASLGLVADSRASARGLLGRVVGLRVVAWRPRVIGAGRRCRAGGGLLQVLKGFGERDLLLQQRQARPSSPLIKAGHLARGFPLIRARGRVSRRLLPGSAHAASMITEEAARRQKPAEVPSALASGAPGLNCYESRCADSGERCVGMGLTGFTVRTRPNALRPSRYVAPA